MDAPSLLGFGSFGFAMVLTPLVRDLVGARGWFDQPDHERKIHSRPVPRVGGIPILLACGISFSLLALSNRTGSGAAAEVLPYAWRLAPAVLTIFAAGLVDDLHGLRPWQKLTCQFAAAALAYWAGIGIRGVGGHPVSAWLGIPLTLLWLAACANAFNLIDGIDGLASGAGLVAALTMLAAGLILHHSGLALVSAALAGAVLGFLRFNFNRASIFLGDCGSLTMGFLLGCCAIVWSGGGASIPAAAAPVLALSVPLLDTALAIVRRVLRRRAVFDGDRDHVHHRLLGLVSSPRRAVLILYAACAAAAAFSLGVSVAGDPWSGALIALFCLSVGIGVHHLGYVELRVAGKLLAPGRLLRAANAEIRLRSLEEALMRAATPDQYWDAVRGACTDLGFTRAALSLDGAVRDAWLQDPCTAKLAWTVRVPLTPAGWVNIGAGDGSTAELQAVAPLASVLQRCIKPKPAPAACEIVRPAVCALPAPPAAAALDPVRVSPAHAAPG